MTKSSVAKVMTQMRAPSRLLVWLAAQPWALAFGLSWIQISVVYIVRPLLSRQRSSHRLDENSLLEQLEELRPSLAGCLPAADGDADLPAHP